MKRRPVLLLLLLTACSLPTAAAPPDDPTANAGSAVTVIVDSPTPAAEEPPPLPDLSQVPLHWFGPLPPMPTGPSRPYTGSDDFMDLFTADAPWQNAASRLQVFKLYGEWVAYHATPAQLEQAVSDIRRRGLALAVEAGPLDPPPECGEGIEGFAGTDEGRLIAERITAAGGTIDLIALDEPYYFAHFYDGPNACHWDAEKVAAEVHEYIQLMRGFFPDLLVGDTEPMPQPVQPEDYTGWLLAFREAAGYDLAFLHVDIDWSRTDWPDLVQPIEEFGYAQEIPVGIIYNGNYGDPDDQAFNGITGERIKRYELEHGGRPAHVLFQSWMDKPDRALPETEPFTYTNLVLTYFEDKERLGFAEGAHSNLALGASVRVSRFVAGNEGALAVDGDSGTLWSAGDFAPQWIEVDLGSPQDIAEIRVSLSQFPAGDSTHRVLGKGADTGGVFVVLHTFQEFTEDAQRLVFTPDAPWEAIQYIRIETVASPSWVAVREIEVIGVE